jgi:hypothetical protein
MGLACQIPRPIACRAGFPGNHPEPNEFVTTTQEDIMQTADIIARDAAAFGAVLPTASPITYVAG